MDNLYHPHQPPLDVARFAWRHKGKMLSTMLVGIVLTMAYLSLAPRSYRSDAKLLVRLGRETVSLDPTATTGQFVAMAESRESEMHGVEELLASRAVAEAIVDKFGPGVILEKRSSGQSLGERLSWLNAFNLNPLRIYSLKDKAVKALQINLGISAGKKSNVLSISYKAKEPQLAHDVLESVLTAVREEHLRVHRTKGSQEFFENQRRLLRSELAKQEQGLREFKDQNGLAALVTQRDAHVGLISSLRSDLLRARAEQSALAAEVELRRQQLADQPALIVTEQTTGQPQNAKQALREKLYELEVKEQELAARLKEDAPQRVQIRAQITEARRIMTDEQMTTEIKRGISQTHQAAALALQEREAQLTAIAARAESLESKVAAASEELKTLNAGELELTRLEREIELARVNYRKYSENLEQARIDQALETAKISSLNLMQPPSLTQTPISPQPLATLGLGLCAAVVASFGVALLADRQPQRRAILAPLPGPVVLEPSSTPVPVRSRRGEVVPVNPR
jgi:uncharacterized protein involved in exopolysaccharide biosynthesis